MPHRLRRIIGVNLKTPKDQGTSCRIVELDTRGAVMALGANGVGKTSFLRLIPLFYGAQPSRILRGSGHESMMRHMLPDASSCVVFEYERESEDDLRCTVVHCHPDEDAPQFHIIKGGFDERYFTREDGDGWVFLKREEFKSHIEGMNVEVSPAMSLSQYRCVILGDRAATKDMVRFRRMAVEHSLAPGTLRGLEHVAAAMGPEALSFGSLQEIVIGRIGARLGAEGKTVRELKKPAKDVISWLSHYDHLSRVQGKAPQARELAGVCADIQQVDFELRELRAAALAMVEQTAAAIRENQAASAAFEQEAQARHERLQQDQAAAQAALNEQVAAVASLDQTVLRIQAGAAHYAAIKVQDLEAEHDREPAILEEKGAAEQEKSRLDDQARGIVQTFEKRRAAANEGFTAVERRVAEGKLAAAKTAAARTAELQAEKADALKQLQPPARLREIPAELQRLAGECGGLEAQIANPSASAETIKALKDIRKDLQQARGDLSAARKHHEQTQRATAASTRERDDRMRASEEAGARTGGLQARLARLEAGLLPKPGTLRAFLRKNDPADLRAVAKAIDPALMDRDDLEPQVEAEVDPAHDGLRVRVGSISLDVQAVDAPEWLDEADLRRQIGLARDAVQAAREAESQAAQDARKAAAALKEAELGEAAAKARLDTLASEVERLEHLEVEGAEALEEEIAARREELSELLQRARARTEEVLREQAELVRAHESRQSAIAKDFDARLEAVQKEAGQAEGRLQAELEQARARHTAQLDELEKDQARELTAAGVDGERIASLERRIEELGSRLSAIAKNRHEVLAWRKFQREDYERLPLEQARLEQATAAKIEAEANLERANAECGEHAAQVSRMREQFESQARQRKADKDDLETLLARELSKIGPLGHNQRAAAWTTQDLMQTASLKTAQAARLHERATSLVRSIRDTMQSTPGPANEWLARKDAEARKEAESLPEGAADAQPYHLQALARGRMLAEWYDSDFASVLGMLHNDLNGVLGSARQFVKDIEDFDREIGRFNTDLQRELDKVKRFPNFGKLKVAVRSSVRELEYMDDLKKMKDLADSRVSLSRMPNATEARQVELPPPEEVALMHKLRDLLQREGGLRASLNELVRLECSLEINGRERRISREDEFKKYASTGNTGMIVSMFLMGFAGMVRKEAGAKVRLTWITDEVGRFDGSNLQAFLTTLDENDIDVISAAPEASGGAAEMFDRLSRFYPNGNIVTAECEELHVA